MRHSRGPTAVLLIAMVLMLAGPQNAGSPEGTRHGTAFAAVSAALTREQYRQLEQAGRLALLETPSALSIHDGQASLTFTLPRQGISLLILEWK